MDTPAHKQSLFKRKATLGGKNKALIDYNNPGDRTTRAASNVPVNFSNIVNGLEQENLIDSRRNSSAKKHNKDLKKSNTLDAIQGILGKYKEMYRENKELKKTTKSLKNKLYKQKNMKNKKHDMFQKIDLDFRNMKESAMMLSSRGLSSRASLLAPGSSVFAKRRNTKAILPNFAVKKGMIDFN